MVQDLADAERWKAKREREIRLTHTYRCRFCGDFVVDKEGYSESEPCPSCGRFAQRPRWSAREKAIGTYMLRDIGQLLIEGIKAPLRQALILCANRLDFEPTKENTLKHNSHVLIDIFDRMLADYQNDSRHTMLKAACKIIVTEHEHDPHYDYMLGRVVEEIVKEVLLGNWKFRNTEKTRYETEKRWWRETQANLDSCPNLVKALTHASEIHGGYSL